MASRASQELRTPFPTWYGEERTANQHLWCAYHNDGRGAWLDRAASFGRLSGDEAGAQTRRACTECKDKDGPTLRRRPYSMLPTLQQCLEFASRLSLRRMGAWRARGFDGDAAARAVGQPEDESEESGSESGDDGLHLGVRSPSISSFCRACSTTATWMLMQSRFACP